MTSASNSPMAARAVEELGRLTLRDHSMSTVLQRVVELTQEVIPGAGEVSISLVTDDRPSTPVYTGKLALDCDESQYRTGHGPCLHAAGTGEVTEIVDMRTESRWADFAREAAEWGALSSLSVPLPISEQIKGALNVYGRAVNAFDDQSRAAADEFAPYAGVVVSNMVAYESARHLADNLEHAMESRAVIDQAKGILMERHKITADQAFQLLARVSMQHNIKLRRLADDLVRTGVLPAARQQ